MNKLILLLSVSSLLGLTHLGAQTPITNLEATGTTKIEGPLQIDDTGMGAAPGLWYVENMHEGFYFFDKPSAVDQFEPSFHGGERVFFWYPEKMALRMGEAFGEYLDAEYLGMYSIGLGYMNKASGFASVALGDRSHASGESSFAFGLDVWASGSRSIAIGRASMAIGFGSVALGELATATSLYSIAIGSNAVSVGQYSVAVGEWANAIGDNSYSFGHSILAEALGSFVIGRANVGGGNYNNWIDTDPLFEIGNGQDILTSNALTTLKNGQTTLDNKFWDEQNPVEIPASSDASQGEALVVNGHARLRGVVVLEQAQGDISMGSFQ